MIVKRLFPKTLTGQTVLVLLIGLTLSHVISMAIYSSDRAEVLTHIGGRDTAQHLSHIAQMIDSSPPAQRNALVTAVNHEGFNVWLTDESPVTHDLMPKPDIKFLRNYLHEQMNATKKPLIHIRVRDAHTESADQWHWLDHWLQGEAGHRELHVSIRLGEKNTQEQWLNFTIDIPQSNPLWSVTSIMSMLAMILAVAAFSFWVVRYLTVPLRGFARAATRLGKDVDAPPLEENGPQEIREAAAAFNEMQARLKRLIQNRTQMLAAISHDLRTPITLLRLRCELVDDSEERTKMQVTLDDMEKMISSTMEFASQDASEEERRKLDLTAMVASICDDMSDAGYDVSFDEPEKCHYECRPLSLQRALVNLVDNALKYGSKANVTMHCDHIHIYVTIEDDGPGIPGDKLDDVFQPFFRCDESRNPETGGSGLGLSVVKSVAHAHGGEVRLSNREEGGLRAELRLPL
ncbi:ATP-binding protein [Magnetovibrio sp. PR-2]|uniref:ATP-binding protein n=1 Tax=Magnetovibrio sp. PR-2 TaxID=3120356 RepID=UPI002FCE2195